MSRDGQLHTLIYDKQDINFHITHFPLMSICRSRVVLSFSLYDAPGLAPHMNALF